MRDRNEYCFKNEICQRCWDKNIAKYGFFDMDCQGITVEDDVKLAVQDGYDEESARWTFDAAYFFGKVYGSPARWYQKEILYCTSKQLAARFCRQTGKSLSMMYKCFHYLMTNSEKHVMVIVPSEKLVAKLWKEYCFRDFIHKSKEIKESVVSSRMSPTYEIEFCNSSKLSINIANDNCVGQTSDWLYADETALIGTEILGKIILTTASKDDAVQLFTSTPRGRGNYFYKVCQEFSNVNEYHVSGDMVEEMSGKLENFMKTLGETLYLQDIMAYFPDTSGGPFNYRGVDLSKADYRYEECTRKHGYIYLGGVDWNGPGVGTFFNIIEFDPTNYIFKVVDKQTISSATWNGLAAKEMLKYLNEKWMCSHWMVDYGYGHCIGIDSEIITKDGISTIKEINIGDSVLTHDGTFQSVTKIFSPEIEKSIYSLTARSHEPIIVSEDHSFLIKRLPQRFKSSRNSIDSKPEWIKVKDINHKIDFISLPRKKYPKEDVYILDVFEFLKEEIANLQYDKTHIWLNKSYSKLKNFSLKELALAGDTSKSTITRIRNKNLNNTTFSKFEESVISMVGDRIFEEVPLIKMNRFINILDTDFLKFVGFFIAEGNLAHKAIELTQYESNLDKSNFFNVIEKFSSITNVEFAIYKTKINIEQLGMVKTCNNEFKFRGFLFGDIINKFMLKLTGKISDTKRIHAVLTDRSNKLMPLLEGLYSGDGHRRITKNGNYYSSLTSTSKQISYQVREILLSNNILPSIKRNKGREDFKNTYTVSYTTPFEEVPVKNYLISEDYFYVPIKSLKYIGETNNLLDLEVENSHSFTVNGICSHNSLTEELRLQSMHADLGTPLSRLKHIIDPVNFGSWLEIEDPFTKEEIKKSTKAFVVSQVARLFEPREDRVPIIISKYDDELIKSLENYKLLSITENGNEKYGFDKKDGIEDHRIDSFMLSIYGVVKNYGELFKRVFLMSVPLEGREILTPKDNTRPFKLPDGQGIVLLTDNSPKPIKLDEVIDREEVQDNRFISRTFNSNMQKRPVSGINNFRRSHSIIKRSH